MMTRPRRNSVEPVRHLRLEPLENRLLLSATVGNQTVELFNTSPALFVENQGQWADESIQFLHQGNGANVAMTDTGPVFQLFRRVGEQEEPFDDGWLGQSEAVPQISLDTTQFSVAFEGANSVTPVGLDRTETYFNYFVGEQDAWRSGVSAYETVAYENLYDGIDLLTWGQRDSLKYEFHVAPGADHHQIQVSYDGIDGLWLDDAGELHVQTSLGELIDEAPYIYQQLDGQQIEVAGEFTLIDANTYTFTITGPYDPTTELIIDPDLAWSTYLGGSDYDYSYGISVDTAGNALVTGKTRSSGWVSGGFDTSYNGGNYDAFVVKLSPTGDHLWSTYLGGSDTDWGKDIAADTKGNALVTGSTASPGWVSGGFDTSYGGGTDDDGFVVKLSPSGDHLWSTYLGGSQSDGGRGVAVDASNNVLVTGLTSSSGWVSGGDDTSHNGYGDAFVVKLSPGGSHLWSTYCGGAESDPGSDIAVDADGNALITGYTYSAPDWVSGGFDTSFNGDIDAFVAKFSPVGGHLWSTYLGGSKIERGFGIAVDAVGNALVTGETSSPGWVSGGLDSSFNGRIDPFVAKLSATGTHVWSTYLGGSEDDKGLGIAADAEGNALVTGSTVSSGWVSGGFDTTYSFGDAFVVKLSPAGGHAWSSYLGGSVTEWGYGIDVDAVGNILVAGTTNSPDWASGGFDTSFNGGNRDAFVARINITQLDAQADAYDVDEDQTLDVSLPGVLENDTHSEGHALTATLADGPSHGQLTLHPDGSFTYAPNSDFHGTDSFTYLATDGDNNSNVATVTITVHSVNDAPLATDDTYTMAVDGMLLVDLPGVLANDTDVEQDALTAVLVDGPAHGEAFTLRDTGSFAYFPEPGYLGPDRFTYKVNDGMDDSAVATVTINVGAASFYPGDADLNGVTDVRDFMLWNVNKFTDGTTWEQGDFDGNGITDVRDFMIWNLHKFTSAPVPTPQVVDEPAMATSLDRAVAGLAWQMEIDRNDDRAEETISAVDKLLASYWPGS